MFVPSEYRNKLERVEKRFKIEEMPSGWFFWDYDCILKSGGFSPDNTLFWYHFTNLNPSFV